jgi:hypothetical protein
MLEVRIFLSSHNQERKQNVYFNAGLIDAERRA